MGSTGVCRGSAVTAGRAAGKGRHQFAGVIGAAGRTQNGFRLVRGEHKLLEHAAALLALEFIDRHCQKTSASKIDVLVKSPKWPLFVIPAKAGIQSFQALLDSRLRGSDDLGDFLRVHQDY